VLLDGNAASHRALWLLRKENPEWRSVVMRSRGYQAAKLSTLAQELGCQFTCYNKVKALPCGRR
jgi:hypothetical protein